MNLTVGGEDERLAERLGGELTAFNQRTTGAYDEAGLSVRVTDADGELIGGLTGATWGGCGFIELLWVRADHRHGGWGSKLMRAAEEEARRRGCTRMTVSSYSFQAPPFYLRHGYVETGRTPGMPGGHSDVSFWKPLDGAALSFQLAVLVDFPEDAAEAALRYEDAVLALLPAHGGRLERRLRTGDGLAEVHLLRFPDKEAYESFLASPERAALGTVAGITARVLEVTEVHGT